MQTCPNISLLSFATSNITGHKYRCINGDQGLLSCSSQNLIYLLTCISCGQQYIGETATKFNLRMNTHRTSKVGCEHVINHKKTCSNCEFSYQILEKLPGTGYDEGGKLDPEATKSRLTREDFWMKRLRTLYPYGLNEKAFDKKCDSKEVDTAVGRYFPPLSRRTPRPARTRSRHHSHEVTSLCSFFEKINNWFDEDKTTLFNCTRVLLNKLPGKLLKAIASEILHPSTFAQDEHKEQLYMFILDIIDTKFLSRVQVNETQKRSPKNICVVKFANKGMDHIHLPTIVHSNDVTSLLPENLRNEENLPVITFCLDQPIRNKILNYKETVSSIKFTLENNVHVVENLPECECHLSEFLDEHHEHVVTGDLRFITNDKLRKLLTKGPNFREPKTVNYNRCYTVIENSLTEFVEKLAVKCNIDTVTLQPWKDKVLSKVKDKISVLKHKTSFRPVKQVLKDPAVVSFLNDLQTKFVLVPIDKASNNIAIICKRFYILRLLQELGISENPVSETYKLCDLPADTVISTNVELCESFNLSVSSKQFSLPFMYWTPKMHYSPCRARFIVASSSCSTKPLSQLVSLIFNKIYHQIENFHRKSHFYKNYNRFWVIENSKPVLERLVKLNKNSKAKSISTFDFSTLYTKLPHNDLIDILSELIDFVFNGGRKTADGNRKFLTIKGKQCFFSRTKHGNKSYTKVQIKLMTKHLISQSFFTLGNLVFHQTVGIPMGIDPAPFWANLYLHHYENVFISTLARTDRYRGFKFKNTFRFIDDACCINDQGEFEASYRNIYPQELQLKCEHKGHHATFLELDITIHANIFVYKLFDKRDNFPFFIVRMPDLSGNIPEHVFYGSISSEFLRIARATLLYDDFLSKGRNLFSRMLKQGATGTKVLKHLDKLFDRHADAFSSFNKRFDTLKADLVQSN